MNTSLSVRKTALKEKFPEPRLLLYFQYYSHSNFVLVTAKGETQIQHVLKDERKNSKNDNWLE